MIIFKYNDTMQRDPWVKYHDGYYYYLCAKNDHELYIAKLKDLRELNDATFTCVYVAPEGTMHSHELWAPELHIIDEKCYIYVACDDGDNQNHRMYVLENHSNNPLDPYVLHGQITDETNKWAIDGSVFEFNGELYYTWSGWEGDENVMQEIFIAKLSDPYTISSKRVSISKPELEWELHGGTPLINEGPVGIVRDGKLFITYSASGSWTNYYAIGLLELVGTDLLDKNSWKKHEKPLVTPTETKKGPGHNSFTTINGETYIVYHQFNEDCKYGWNSVNVHLDKINWVDGYPVFEEI
jgi:GH43 family beta-xylosidase